MPRKQPKPKANTRPTQSPIPPMSKRRATIYLTCLITFLLVLLGGAVTNGLQLFAPVVIAVAASVGGLLLVAGTIYSFVFGAEYAKDFKSFFATVWKQAKKRLSFGISLIISAIISIVLVFLSIPLTHVPVGGKLLPPPIATLAASKHLLLKQQVPNCNNPPGVSWYVHVHSTYIFCTSSYLIMRDIRPNDAADMELAQVHYQTYNQTIFHVEVQLIFQNPSITSIFAGLLVQTPAQVNVTGGFTLVLSPTGKWELQEVFNGGDIEIIDNGIVKIDLHKPVILAVDVNGGVLVGSINGQQVTEYNDPLSPSPGRVDLEVQGIGAEIFFSNFELDG